ncbi:MAG: hypothetical protein RLZZ262_1610 [Bacteroidota bacterium]|jgi:hypothetical protein
MTIFVLNINGMKKSILFIAFAALCSCLNAQIVVLEGENNVLYGTSSNASEQLEDGWDVVCNASQSTDIKCSATVLQLATGAKFQYCWGVACSPWISANNTLPDPVTMASQETNSTFHIKYRHYGNAGQSVVRFCWYDANNAAEILCYDVNFCVDVEGGCVISVKENVVEAAISQISPNPANDVATVGYEFSTRPTNAVLSIYNMVGELVDSYAVTQRVGQMRINTRQLQGGIYFVTLTEEGKKFETKRLVVTH